jgi:NADH:ubiquinone oxidoreductase subunit F (NADH-binding)
LRRIQAWRGYVPETEITALLETLKTPDQFEPAAAQSKPSESASGSKTARVCVGLACTLAGSEDLCRSLQSEGYDVIRETCLSRCWSSPAAIIGDRAISGTTRAPETVPPDPAADIEAARDDLQAYMNVGGYSVLKNCLTRRRSIESVLAEWSTPAMAAFESAAAPLGVRIKELGATTTPPKLLLILGGTGAISSRNAFYLEHHRHAVLEGLLITARVAGAQEIIVHWPAQQAFEVKRLKAALAILAETFLDQHVRFAFTEPEGGDRSLAQQLFASGVQYDVQAPQPNSDGRTFATSPILILEPSLLRWLPEMLSKGAHWLAGLSSGNDRPPNLYLVYGRVRSPGVYLAAAGSTVKDLIQIAGGIEPGHTFESFVAGDWSNPALPSRFASVQLAPHASSEPRSVGDNTGRLVESVVVISARDSASRQCVFASDVAASCAPVAAPEHGEV